MHYVYAAMHVKKQLLSRLNYVIAGGNIVIDVIDVTLGLEVNLGLAETNDFRCSSSESKCFCSMYSCLAVCVKCE